MKLPAMEVIVTIWNDPDEPLKQTEKRIEFIVESQHFTSRNFYMAVVHTAGTLNPSAVFWRKHPKSKLHEYGDVQAVVYRVGDREFSGSVRLCRERYGQESILAYGFQQLL